MPSVDYDLIYLQAGVELLEDYLVSEDLYRAVHVAPPSGEPPYPSLTPGGLLLAAQRLAGRADHPGSQAAVLQSFASLRSRWRTAWEGKVERDLRARVNQWMMFLNDYREARSEHANRYPYEVRLRVMIDLLCAELPVVPDDVASGLVATDLVLSASTHRGGFVWQADLQPAFPAGRFPYLYASLAKES